VSLASLLQGSAAAAQDAGIRLVQVSFDAQTPGNSVKETFPSRVAPGDAVVLAINWVPASSTPTIVDDCGTTYGVVAGPATMAQYSPAVYFAFACDAGVGAVFYNVPDASWLEINQIEYTGIDRLHPVDAVAVDGGVPGQAAAGPVITTQSADLLLAWMPQNSGTNPAIGAGFTLVDMNSQDIVEDEVTGAPGPYEATATSPADWAMLAVAFRAASMTPGTDGGSTSDAGLFGMGPGDPKLGGLSDVVGCDCSTSPFLPVATLWFAAALLARRCARGLRR
jgi:hypothetical protein